VVDCPGVSKVVIATDSDPLASQVRWSGADPLKGFIDMSITLNHDEAYVPTKTIVLELAFHEHLFRDDRLERPARLIGS
jgi:hypothetical protein